MDIKLESVKLDRETIQTLRYCADVLGKPVGRLMAELLREPMRLIMAGASKVPAVKP